MPRRKTIDPDVIGDEIGRSVAASPNRSRRLLSHTLFAKFGFRRRNEAREVFVEEVLGRYGVEVDPSLTTASTHDWVVLRLKGDTPHIAERADGGSPSKDWFNRLLSVAAQTEREVELHFVSPLFRQLGYSDEQEAAGLPVEFWEGVQHRRTIADLVYFEGSDHSESGNALVLVECKDKGVDVLSGIGQVKSYAYWVRPAYYVITNGETLRAFLYLGGSVPDKQVLSVDRDALGSRFGEVSRILSRTSAIAVKRQLQEQFDRMGLDHAAENPAHPEM